MNDPISHPAHYNASAIEPIDVIEAWRLCFHLGSVVKYIARAAHKGSELDDLRKARWYLDRRISEAEKKLKKKRDAEDDMGRWLETQAAKEQWRGY